MILSELDRLASRQKFPPIDSSVDERFLMRLCWETSNLLRGRSHPTLPLPSGHKIFIDKVTAKLFRFADRCACLSLWALAEANEIELRPFYSLKQIIEFYRAPAGKYRYFTEAYQAVIKKYRGFPANRAPEFETPILRYNFALEPETYGAWLLICFHNHRLLRENCFDVLTVWRAHALENKDIWFSDFVQAAVKRCEKKFHRKLLSLCSAQSWFETEEIERVKRAKKHKEESEKRDKEFSQAMKMRRIQRLYEEKQRRKRQRRSA